MQHVIQQLYFFNLLANIGVLLFSLLFLAGGLQSPSRMQHALFASAVSFGLSLYHQHFQRRPFQLRAIDWQRVIPDSNLHYLLYTLAFLFLGSGSLMALVPLCIFAVFNCGSLSIDLLVDIDSPLVVRARRLSDWLRTRSAQLLDLVAWHEFLVTVMSLVGLLSGQSSLVLSFILVQFLRLRCRFSRESATLIHQLASHRFCPSLLGRLLRRVLLS